MFKNSNGPLSLGHEKENNEITVMKILQIRDLGERKNIRLSPGTFGGPVNHRHTHARFLVPVSREDKHKHKINTECSVFYITLRWCSSAKEVLDFFKLRSMTLLADKFFLKAYINAVYVVCGTAKSKEVQY